MAKKNVLSELSFTLNRIHCCCLSFRHVCAHVLFCFSFPGCTRANGVQYRGEVHSSSSGLTCLNWANTSRDYDDGVQPDSQTGKTPSGRFNTEISKWPFELFLYKHSFLQE